jgi:hypothetical protein
MAYIINRWDSTEVAIIQDGTVYQGLDVKLIGKNYAGYGEIQNENTLHLLENFARATEPPNAIRGQIWYDTANKKIKFYTGDATVSGEKTWKIAGGTEYAAAAPLNPTDGDLWFNTETDQLNIRNGTDWLTIGPQSAGSGLTQMVSREVLGTDRATPHAIIAATVDTEVVYIVSNDADFILREDDPNSVIAGFTKIKRGITFQSTDAVTGVSADNDTSGFALWGTASSALRLGQYTPNDFILKEDAGNIFLDDGFTVGNGQDLKIAIETGINPVIEAQTGPAIYFRVKAGSGSANPMAITNTGLIPGNPTATPIFDIGSVNGLWKNIYANRLIGVADNADRLLTGAVNNVPQYSQASVISSVNTIVVRDASQAVYASAYKGGAADTALKLANPVSINNVPFDGSINITVADTTKLPTAGGSMTGALVLPASLQVTIPAVIDPITQEVITPARVESVTYPSADQHAAPKKYVDDKFGQGGLLGVASGGTGASTDTGARSNLNVPKRDGTDATGTWNINIGPSAGGVGGTAAVATKATNMAGGLQGSISYQQGPDTSIMLGIGAVGQVLISTGSVPEWKNIGDLATGAAALVAVANKQTDIGTFYPTFVNALSGNAGICVDSDLYTYSTNTNTLTVKNLNATVSIVGDIYANNGTGIVLENGTDGFDAVFTGRVNGTADELTTARTITLTGAVTSQAIPFDGSADIQIPVTLPSSFSIELGTNTTGNYVKELVAGSYVVLKESSNPYVPGEGDTISIEVDATDSATNSTIVARDGVGNFSANIISATEFSGVATSAKYADLAEKYLADADYEPGTVVCIGGDAEVTATIFGDRALGVVSTAPAFMMNRDLEGGIYIALKGRVPCKVIGAVRKGQRLVATNNGYAVAGVPHSNDVFAIALESSTDTGVKVIEVAVL